MRYKVIKVVAHVVDENLWLPHRVRSRLEQIYNYRLREHASTEYKRH